MFNAKFIYPESKSSAMNQDTALALLQTAAAEGEEASDQIVKQFLDKELQIDGFLEQFMVSRKTMHLRKLKAEKMNELIWKGGANSGFNNYNRSFYPYQPTVGGGVNVPYPIGINMPMPGNFWIITRNWIIQRLLTLLNKNYFKNIKTAREIKKSVRIYLYDDSHLEDLSFFVEIKR